jgi:hypothetical protein
MVTTGTTSSKFFIIIRPRRRRRHQRRPLLLVAREALHGRRYRRPLDYLLASRNNKGYDGLGELIKLAPA